jgi:tetratricopeptide (TPR) repeat protein
MLGTPGAIDLLRRLTSGTFGDDGLRVQALQALQNLGVAGPDPARLWLRGAWTEVALRRHEVTPEAVPPLPEEVEDLAAGVIVALRSKEWALAESLARRVVAAAPELPSARQNLAVALENLGRHEEADAILMELRARHPDYLFAAASLLERRLQQNRIEEAIEISKSTKLPDRIHPQAIAVWSVAQIRLAIAEGALEAASTQMEHLEKLVSQGEARLPEGDAALGLAQLATDIRLRRQKRDERRRARLLRPDAGVKEALDGLTVPELTAIAATWGARPASPHKADVLEAIARACDDSERIRRVAGAVPAASRTALDAVLSAGGAMPYEQFAREHGPKSTAGGRQDACEALKRAGLLVEGTIGGCVHVLVPAEARRALAPGSTLR